MMADWFDRPMRWAQLTLVETDPVHYDVDFWLDFLTGSAPTRPVSAAGGCFAFYPTQLPFHYRTPGWATAISLAS